MSLALIGIGLGTEDDITVKGLSLVKNADKVYLENYTSILCVDKDKLELFYGREIIILDRESVEDDSSVQEILDQAKDMKVALLVVGDVFSATTHSDFYLRARREGVEVVVIHNASIVSAVGACGMQVYRFGQIVSLPFFTEKWRPYSFYEKIKQNREIGLHTLVLLDIKVKEPTEHSLLSGYF